MVAPEREIPGIMASPWARPMIRAARIPTRLKWVYRFGMNRVAATIIPVTRSIIATMGTDWKSLSTGFLKARPMNPVGIVPTTTASKREP